MKQRCACILLCLFIFSLPVSAAQKMRLAILDLKPQNVSGPTASMVSDLLRTELFNTGLFRVIERSEMESVLKEQNLQLTGCTDTECAVQLGKILSARKMLIGTIGRLGTKYIINARIVDVERGEMEFGDSAKAASEGDLDMAVKVFAKKLAGRINTKNSGGVARSTDIRQPAPADRSRLFLGLSLGTGYSWNDLGHKDITKTYNSMNYMALGFSFHAPLFDIDLLGSPLVWMEKVQFVRVLANIHRPLRRFGLGVGYAHMYDGMNEEHEGEFFEVYSNTSQDILFFGLQARPIRRLVLSFYYGMSLGGEFHFENSGNVFFVYNIDSGIQFPPDCYLISAEFYFTRKISFRMEMIAAGADATVRSEDLPYIIDPDNESIHLRMTTLLASVRYRFALR